MDSNGLRKTGSALLGLISGAALVAAGVFVYVNYLAPVQETSTVAALAPLEFESRSNTESLDRESGISELKLAELPRQSRSNRILALHNHLMNEDVDFVVEFLEKAQSLNPLQMRREVQEASIRRLAQINPVRALREVKRRLATTSHFMTTVVFEEWSVSDLDAAIKHARSLNNESRRYALEGLLLSRHDLSESRQLEIARQLGHEQVVADTMAMALAGEPVENPESAWVKFLEDHVGDAELLSNAQAALLNHIVVAWADGGEASDLASAIISALQDSSNVSAVQLLLETWVDNDPTVALEASSAIEDPETRNQLQQAIVTAWVGIDPVAVLDSIDLVPAELQDWSKREALVALSATSPADAANRLEILSGSDRRGEVAGNIATNWARLDPQAARDWIDLDPLVQDLRWGLMYRLVWEAARTDAEQAMKWALEEPTNEMQRGRGLEVTVVRSVAQKGDTKTAMALASQARDVENKQWAYVGIGNVLVYRGGIDDTLNLMDEIPERFHNVYQEQVISNWVYFEPDIAMARLESLESDGVREDLARTLAFHNSSSHMFSKKQMRKVKKHLQEIYHHLVE